MRKALGKGIAALLPSAETPRDRGSVGLIELKKIKANKYQARKDFNQEKINELANSIRKKGLIQPIVVASEGDGYRLIAGERRFRAAKSADLKEIPAIVRKSSNEDMLELSLIENLQRENLNVLEEAEAYQSLMRRFNLTQEQVAERVNKQRSVIANTLRLLKLPGEVKDALSNNLLSPGHARSISSIKDRKIQINLLKKIVRERLTVREVETIISKMKTRGKVKRSKKEKPPEIINLEEKIRDLLGTKVLIKSSGKKGKIEIHWYSHSELERLTELLYKINI